MAQQSVNVRNNKLISPPDTPPPKRPALKLSQLKRIRDCSKLYPSLGEQELALWAKIELELELLPDLRSVRKCISSRMSFLDRFTLDGEYGELISAEQLRYALADAALIASLPAVWPYSKHELYTRANGSWDRVRVHTGCAPHFGEHWLQSFRRKYEQKTGQVLQIRGEHGGDILNAQGKGQQQPGRKGASSGAHLAQGVQEDLARDDAAQALMAIKDEHHGQNLRDIPIQRVRRDDVVRLDTSADQASSSVAVVSRAPPREGGSERYAYPSEHVERTRIPILSLLNQEHHPPIVPSRHTPESIPDLSKWLDKSAQVAAKSELTNCSRQTEPAQVMAGSGHKPRQEHSRSPQRAADSEPAILQSTPSSSQGVAESSVATPSRRPGKLQRTNHLPSVNIYSSSPPPATNRKARGKTTKRTSVEAKVEEVELKQEALSPEVVVLQEAEATEQADVYHDIDAVFEAVTYDTVVSPASSDQIQQGRATPLRLLLASEDFQSTTAEVESGRADGEAGRSIAIVETVPVEKDRERSVNTAPTQAVSNTSKSNVDMECSSVHTSKRKLLVKLRVPTQAQARSNISKAETGEPKGGRPDDMVQSCHTTIGENVKQRGQERRASSLQAPQVTKSRKRSTTQRSRPRVTDSDDEPLMSRGRKKHALTSAVAQQDTDVQDSITVYRTTKVALSETHHESIMGQEVAIRTEATAQTSDTIQAPTECHSDIQPSKPEMSDIAASPVLLIHDDTSAAASEHQKTDRQSDARKAPRCVDSGSQTVAPSQASVGVQVHCPVPVEKATQTTHVKYVDRGINGLGPDCTDAAAQTIEDQSDQPSELPGGCQSTEFITAKQLGAQLDSFRTSMEASIMMGLSKFLVALATPVDRTDSGSDLKRKQDDGTDTSKPVTRSEHGKPSCKRRCVRHYDYSIRVRRAGGTVVRQAVCSVDKGRRRRS